MPARMATACALPDDELDNIAKAVRQAVPEVKTETYYGTDAKPQRV